MQAEPITAEKNVGADFTFQPLSFSTPRKRSRESESEVGQEEEHAEDVSFWEPEQDMSNDANMSL